MISFGFFFFFFASVFCEASLAWSSIIWAHVTASEQTLCICWSWRRGSSGTSQLFGDGGRCSILSGHSVSPASSHRRTVREGHRFAENKARWLVLLGVSGQLVDCFSSKTRPAPTRPITGGELTDSPVCVTQQPPPPWSVGALEPWMHTRAQRGQWVSRRAIEAKEQFTTVRTVWELRGGFTQ